jgi:hypothetical protein
MRVLSAAQLTYLALAGRAPVSVLPRFGTMSAAPSRAVMVAWSLRVPTYSGGL